MPDWKGLLSWFTPGGAMWNAINMGATIGQRLREPDRSGWGDNARSPQPNAYPHRTGIPETYSAYPDPYLYNTPGRTNQTIAQEVQGARRDAGLSGDRLRDELNTGIPAPAPLPNPLAAAGQLFSMGTRVPKASAASPTGATPNGAYNSNYPELAGATMNQWLKEGGQVKGLTNPWLSTAQQGNATQQGSATQQVNTSSGGSGSGTGSYSNRSRNAWLDGLRPGLSQWADAFEDEHRGRSVFEVYGGAPAEDLSNSQINYALSDALLDKAWGDKFYDTYHRPPSEDDWKASYNDRERLKYKNESPWGGPWQG